MWGTIIGGKWYVRINAENSTNHLYGSWICIDVLVYRYANHVPHAKHVKSSIRQNGEEQSKQCTTDLRLSRSQVSKQSKSLRC